MTTAQIKSDDAAKSDATRGGPSTARFEVSEFLRLLNRRKWHLAGVTSLVLAIAGIILAQLTPEYRATALVIDRRAHV